MKEVKHAKRIVSSMLAIVMTVCTLIGCNPAAQDRILDEAKKEAQRYAKEKASEYAESKKDSKDKKEKKKESEKKSKSGKKSKKSNKKSNQKSVKKSSKKQDKYKKVIKYNGNMIVEMNGNVPEFTKSDRKKTVTYTKYSNLDSFGRCGKVKALIGPETLADEKRGSIGMYKPTGWHTIRYDVVGKGSAGYLYNRCHLLAFCLNGNTTNNEKNLITGTRQFNAGKESMLTYELKTVKYIEATGNHVLYRVTPVFRKNELVARGVQMEGYSIEDKGGLKFNVFVHNHQDGITLDYKTGESKADNGEVGKSSTSGY